MKKLLTTAAIASALLLSPLAFAQEYYLVVPLNPYQKNKNTEATEDEHVEPSVNINLQLPFGWSDDLKMLHHHPPTTPNYSNFISEYSKQPFITINIEIEGTANAYVIAELQVVVVDKSGETKFDNFEMFEDLFTESGELKINTPDIDITEDDSVVITFDLDLEVNIKNPHYVSEIHHNSISRDVVFEFNPST